MLVSACALTQLTVLSVSVDCAGGFLHSIVGVAVVATSAADQQMGLDTSNQNRLASSGRCRHRTVLPFQF